jgi:methyl-accepting chemotaxis protein
MFRDLSLKTKLLAPLGVLALALAFMTFAAFSGQAHMQAAEHASAHESGAITSLQELNSDFQLAVSKAKNYAILQDQHSHDTSEAFLTRAEADMDHVMEVTDEDDMAHNREHSAALKDIRIRLQALFNETDHRQSAKALYDKHLHDVTLAFDSSIDQHIKEARERYTQAQSAAVASAAAARNALSAGLAVALTALVAALIVAFSVNKMLHQTLAGIVGNLDEGAKQVAAGAEQLSSASQSLASGASESASKLEETNSALEEVGAMSRQNAGNAEKASQLMLETRQSVSRGSEAVAGTVQSMQAMSESADRVSRIIKTIEEIAFQTNLLALNAAVEAARAGEHGRGFAVVAEEVRNLASRSASAAKETANLLEANAERVANGEKISRAAGEALDEIVGNAQKATQLVQEIAVACIEQSKGIQEITVATSQLDKVTQSNAANAEESSSVSEELSSQAFMLRESVVELAGVLQGRTREQHLAPAPAAPKATATRAAVQLKTLKAVPSTPKASVNGYSNGNGSSNGNGRTLSLEEVMAF